MALPGALLNWVEGRFLKVTSLGLVPNDSGTLEFVVTGTSTPKVTYADSDLTTPSTVNGSGYVTLDAEGRPTDGAIYLEPGGYDVTVRDSDDVELYTVENFEDNASTFFASFGTISTEGARDVTGGYTVLASDNLITVNDSGTVVINLPAATARVAGTTTSGLPITIKNVGSGTLEITPNGSDTIEDVSTSGSPYTMAAASSPSFPTITLASDGVSNWWLVSSHGV